MKTVNILSVQALMLLLAGCSSNLPEVVNFPFTEGNTMLPATEVVHVERTDTSTIVTLMAMYDYQDFDLRLNPNMFLSTGEYDSRPLKSITINGSTEMNNGIISLKKGIPSEVRLSFPPIPEDAESIDLVNVSSSVHGPGSIWGIDLTGKRPVNELPDGIPADLLQHDLSGDVPAMVSADSTGTATVKLHAVAYRSWINPYSELVVNTINDTQERKPFKFDEKGEATVEFPVTGTAQITVYTKANTYAATYIDPNETIDIYLLPNNYSESQRYDRPSGVSSGKYRDSEILYKELIGLDNDSDTLLCCKTDREEYFDAIIKIYENGLDSLAARNYPHMIQRRVRARIDTKLMYHVAYPINYITSAWYPDKTCTLDSFPDFTAEQLSKVRSLIDFDNPAFELYSIGNPGNRSRFLKAKESIVR